MYFMDMTMPFSSQRYFLGLPSENFWDMTQCNVVESYQRFGGTCCLHFQGSPRK
jgi:hypothetical protein